MPCSRVSVGVSLTRTSLAFGLVMHEPTTSPSPSTHQTSHTVPGKNTIHRTVLKKRSPHTPIKMSFEPKTKIELDPPKDDIISLEYLSKCDGELSRLHYAASRSCTLVVV